MDAIEFIPANRMVKAKVWNYSEADAEIRVIKTQFSDEKANLTGTINDVLKEWKEGE